MFEVNKKEIRKGDYIILGDGRKGKVRDVEDRLTCCDGDTRSRTVIEIGLGEQVSLSNIVSVTRCYQPGDWRAA